MFTMEDLSIEADYRSGDDSSIWERVTVSDGRKFLVGSCDLSTPEALENADEQSQLLYFLRLLPAKETWVMEAVIEDDGQWGVKNKCGEQCATGVCNKRLATSVEVASQEHGYKMLLDALNA